MRPFLAARAICGRRMAGCGYHKAVFRACGIPLILVVLGIAPACAPKVQWASRVGNYTYDQAIRELGPPDRAAGLSDGSTVAEWLESRGGAYVHTSGFGGYRFGSGPMTTYASRSPDNFLRLTFRPDRSLEAWQRVYK
ncbi:MAG: hypothetical protein EXS36_00975 [Pedosphaera sp.]|nr:hypothetical protein [Pedosphaera sp.]